MPPPTPTDDKQGTVIDGTARSAKWRKKQRAAQRPQDPRSPEASTDVPAADFDPAAAKDFVSSLMIPANKLAGETRTKPPAPEAPDAYIKPLNGSPEQPPTRELEEDAEASSTQSDELDRWFEEQATSVPRAPAGRALPGGSASLDIETAAGVGAERARRGRALRVRIARARETRQQRHGPTGRRRVPARVHVTRTRVVAGTTLTVLPIVAIAIAAGGSPAHRSPVSSAPASTSTTFPGVLGTFMSKAGRLPVIEGLGVHARRQDRRPSHRTRRAPRHRPIAPRAVLTGAAPSSSYTPRLTSQADSSPAPAASASSTTSGGGSGSSPAPSTSSGGGSSPAASSSPQARTGPSGPISLIGAGTTPSG